MKIIKADKAGFCFGVERAVSIAEQALRESSEPVASLGPIIHNPQVVQDLEKRGLRVVRSLDEVSTGTVIIRSHGAPPATFRQADEAGLTVLDTTCPFVKKMHSLARDMAREGYKVLLCGELDHPEIQSLLGDADFKPLVVNAPAELHSHRLGHKVALLSQTTQSVELFSEVARETLAMVRELRIFNTICDSTKTRQDESLDIARRVQAMIVIGGRNSANTRRLYDICSSSGTPTHHVEVPEELRPEWFAGCLVVGVTAGASTPKRLIDQVVRKIKTLNPGGG